VRRLCAYQIQERLNPAIVSDMNPWIWAIGALLTGIAELHCPGCYLIWIAAGGAITALASFAFDLSLSSQISVFSTSCIATCICGYFVYRRFAISGPERAFQKSTSPINQRDLSLIGTRGIIADSIHNGRGKVKLGDSVWLAEGPDLMEGAAVVVTDVRGTVVTVSPL
jgi:membrane protein implicated in regulation of membrane protease activity